MPVRSCSGRRLPARLCGPKLAHSELFRRKDRGGTTLFCAEKCRGSPDLGVFHIRMRQRTLSLIEPFNALVSSRLFQGGQKQSTRRWIGFASHHGDVERSHGEFMIGKK
jgi:hypothetical protein